MIRSKYVTATTGQAVRLLCCVMACAGMEGDAAFTRIAAARGLPVPDTGDQRAWASAFADTLPLLP